MREWLIKRRKDANFTQEEVSLKAGISRGYYANIERGRYKIPTETAKKIAILLGFEWTKFYENEPAKSGEKGVSANEPGN